MDFRGGFQKEAVQRIILGVKGARLSECFIFADTPEGASYWWAIADTRDITAQVVTRLLEMCKEYDEWLEKLKISKSQEDF